MPHRSRVMLFRSLALTYLLILPAASPAVSAERKVRWRHDLQQAVDEAARTGKPLLVQVTASWCGYCRKMYAETFTDDRVVEHVNGCFVPVSVDADRNPDFLRAAGVEGLPATLIVSPQRRILKRLTGFMPAARFDAQLARLCPAHHEVAVPADPPLPERLRDEVAFDGYCLTSLVDERRLVKGTAQHSLVYRGKRLRFASAEAKAKFQAHPDRYWPADDGRCPVSAADENVQRVGHPRFAVRFGERMWFLSDEEHLERFMSRPQRYASAPMP